MPPVRERSRSPRASFSREPTPAPRIRGFAASKPQSINGAPDEIDRKPDISRSLSAFASASPEPTTFTSTSPEPALPKTAFNERIGTPHVAAGGQDLPSFGRYNDERADIMMLTKTGEVFRVPMFSLAKDW